MVLHDELKEMLALLRAGRGFDAARYLDAKCLLINNHFRSSGLDTAVAGVSGGSDSAVVIGILAHAASLPDSPIKRIVAVLAPYRHTVGTTNQDVATDRGREVAERFGVDCFELDLASSHAVLKSSADTAVGIDGDQWAAGQLVSYLRTPAFYYVVSLLSQEESAGVFVGSTNRDEGGFIGYFGKAADAMADIQLISDIHKSEVVRLAELLKVPQSVLDAAPAGDVYDGRTDEELIGVPYDFIELYTLLLGLKNDGERRRLSATLCAEARAEFERLAGRLERLNSQNAHKYYGNSPAAHFDIYKRGVPRGWRVETIASRAPNSGSFVNRLEVDRTVISDISSARKPFDAGEISKREIADFGESAFVLDGVLSSAECASLLTELDREEWLPVGIDGMRKSFDPATDTIGSWRATLFSDQLARTLWTRIAPHVPSLRIMDDLTPTDWDDERVWRSYGVSPVMRFIKYAKNGLLVPHYDSTHVRNEDKRTLMSVVLYLTDGDPANGGATRFIFDPQSGLPVKSRDLSDWSRLASDDEVIVSVAPPAGSILVFDHRLLHDSDPIRGASRKVIMRTDVKFHRGGLLTRQQATVCHPLGKPEHS